MIFVFGSNLAGYTRRAIAGLFVKTPLPETVVFSREWLQPKEED